MHSSPGYVLMTYLVNVLLCVQYSGLWTFKAVVFEISCTVVCKFTTIPQPTIDLAGTLSELVI